MKSKMETETQSTTEEKDPILYNPKIVGLIANASSWASWLVLVGILADVIAQFVSMQATITQQGMSFADLLKEPSAIAYMLTNLVTPFVTGLALFLLMQGVSVGLNVLMEMDFNQRGEE